MKTLLDYIVGFAILFGIIVAFLFVGEVACGYDATGGEDPCDYRAPQWGSPIC